MASKNVLLGSGKPIEVEEVEDVFPPPKVPAWRFHKTCREGILAKTEEELAKLDAAGWVSHPGKIFLLPGHEHLFEGDEQIKLAVENTTVDSLEDFQWSFDSEGESNIDLSEKKKRK